MNSAPLISIVTVCLNSADHIERCINSVINQSYTNIEYIIIDGGSTDGTLDIIKSYEDKINRWVSEKDRGIYDAMNKGIAICTGEYIGLLNSDDYYAPDAVQVVVDAILTDSTVEMVHGNIVVTHRERSEILIGNHNDLLRHWSVYHNSCFISSASYKLYKYDISIKISADYDLVLKLYFNGRRFKHVDHVILYFSPYGASSTPTWSERFVKFRIRAKYNLPVALKMLLKQTVMHFDDKFYAFSSDDKYKTTVRYLLFSRIKNVIKPLYLFIKKSLLNT